jgi:hypothetical protein
MAIKLDYVARETATNLTRNVTLTLASILTVVVSLTLFGSAVMLNQGVNNANDRFKGGIEFIVFLQPDVTADQRDSIERDLEANPDVRDITYVDQDETYEEFKRIFEGQTQLIETVSPEVLPPSFRVAPETKDPEVERFGYSEIRLHRICKKRGSDGRVLITSVANEPFASSCSIFTLASIWYGRRFIPALCFVPRSTGGRSPPR